MPAPVRYLTTAEVADLLQVSPATVRLLHKDGALPASTVHRGRALRYHPDDVAAYQQTRRETKADSEPVRLAEVIHLRRSA